MRRHQIAMIARAAWRVGFPVLILAVCILLLARQIPTDAVARLPGDLADISALQWVLAACLTAGSFWAVAQYDVQAHRMLGTNISDNRARGSGAVGIAIGQTVGFGLVSGALARWRMLPDIGAARALQLSTVVALSFVVAWACLTGLVSAIAPAPAWTMPLSITAVLALPLGALVLYRCPTIYIGRHKVPLPSLPVAGAILIWALVDMVLAAAALWVLMPPTVMGFLTLLPLFMIALGCGLMSNTPGGVGPFELVLIAALPISAETGGLAAILAFRIVYYALPACLAMLAMLRPRPAPSLGSRARAPLAWRDLPRSEAQALKQNGGRIEALPTGQTAPVWHTAQTRTLFTASTGPARTATLTWLRQSARRHGRIALLYKSDARLAARARCAGWAVLHVADDAIVDLDRYDENAPTRRRLRRKLRAARKTDITLCSGTHPDAEAAAQLDRAWQSSSGPARGGSMGRYCPSYVSNQWVVSAYSGVDLVGFITLHRGPAEWCLDLMRHSDDVPDGVMHALVHQALTDARAHGVARVNLASIVACPDPTRGIWRGLARAAVTWAGGPGLRQFKSAFAPRWVPRYAAAPSWAGLVLGLADLARVIRKPAPLAPVDTNPAHHDDENYELASHKAA
ncbi:MAG: phosphatidylglycerol lysyltransferase domain-containing protein [Pseudomonadota bacterium]